MTMDQEGIFSLPFVPYEHFWDAKAPTIPQTTKDSLFLPQYTHRKKTMERCGGGLEGKRDQVIAFHEGNDRGKMERAGP